MKTKSSLRLALVALSCLSLGGCKSEFANGFLVGAGVTLGVVTTAVVIANSARANQTGYVSGTSNNTYVPYNRVTGEPYPGSGPTPSPRPTAVPSPASTPRPTPRPTATPTPIATLQPTPVPSASSPAIVFTDPTPSPSVSASPSPSPSPAACTGSDCPVVILKPATTKDAIIPVF